MQCYVVAGLPSEGPPQQHKEEGKGMDSQCYKVSTTGVYHSSWFVH